MNRRLSIALLFGFSLSACGFLPREAVVPMPTQFDKTSCAASADTLLVLLPGRGMLPAEFAGEGFIDAVRSNRLAVDVLRADAHIAYYEQQLIVRQLREDVIAPAQARGYRKIWLVGISLGGAGALAYANEYPADITGIVALAPYLGEQNVIDDVASAGGLKGWVPPTMTDDIGRKLWRSLKPHAAERDPPGRPVLYLGYGLDDRLGPGHRQLGAALPTDRVFTAAGGHDWPAWKQLWATMLPRLQLPGCP